MSAGEMWASDPSIVAAPDGTFYVVWDGANDTNIWIATAPTGTYTFGAPNLVAGPDAVGLDKPWLAQTASGALIVTYTLENSFTVVSKRSTDHGKTWSAATPFGSTSVEQAFICPSAAGTTINGIAMGSDRLVHLLTSTDDGQTWSHDISVSTGADRTAYNAPSCVANGSDVYVVYARSKVQPPQGTLPASYAIRVAHSGDSGASIDARVDVQDVSSGAAVFLNPFIARETSGALDVAYFAGTAVNDSSAKYVVVRSTDGGSTWGSASTIGAPVTLNLATLTDSWLGDYQAMTTTGGTLFVTFADNSSGHSHVSFFSTGF
jgi:photosystem II stability/assembly factor-like uncharacterized protein